MKRPIISALAIVAFSIGAFAAEFTHSLIVNLKSGATVEYLFVDEPAMTFVGDDVKISALKGETFLQPASEVQNITFNATPTGVEDVGTDESRIVVGFDGIALSIAGLSAGSEVRIYSVAGMLFTFAEADDAGRVVVDVRDLPGGIYVAASNEHKFKFVKK